MPPPRTSTSAVLSCTPKRLFLVVPCLFAVILLTEVLMLPNLIGVAALPVPTTADNSAPDEGAQVAVAAPPASLRPVTGAPPNISVIMPCYGHVQFLEEALNSVIKQQYPPAEILVVDDGSPEECGKFASDMLDGSLASARRRSIRQLQTWWGWGDGDMVRFRDEVLVTPNRGVAHARNSGIRRARGDWIMCLDADDTVSPNYFMEAMAHVAQQPATNLVYADQQFFGESRWQWHVPDVQRVDMALVNGPLPLMTLFRRALWQATPHGFDEALPKGHEDWAFWLQLTRLALKPHKLEGFLTQVIAF